ncbi:membrane protein [Dulcicalothrix desertica PCC 7102]|uniref:Membrane protein n=1 Tax=Dulcicalothrix desertica PCC 7102 TaxID=232991 RepID=A0A3S1AEL8_9CYAN|nr:DUF1345 domain-containing protein [Dulcicalothrix desertica]RUS99335.1 membrane protein [Dulcicalothrix desertica PCC 7102]TWH49999.1 putative membrane protein [Dulcicalothrix desertica PCC 7102]
MYTAPKLFRNLDIRPRLLISIVGAVLVATLLLPSWLHLSTRILCGWNAGVDVFLVSTLWNMFRATPEKMRRYALTEYQGRLTLLLLVTAAASASIFAIGFLLSDTKGLSISIVVFHVVVSALTIVGSWLLVHTMFALEYAYRYYHDTNITSKQSPCLDFPNETDPDYWDFLYFSFVIGMTSQVSDVQTTSRLMRRLALLHGIISFFFNTSILAMSINIIAALI